MIESQTKKQRTTVKNAWIVCKPHLLSFYGHRITDEIVRSGQNESQNFLGGGTGDPGGDKEVGLESPQNLGKERGITFYRQIDLSSLKRATETLRPGEGGVKGILGVWGIVWGPTFINKKTRG
jgi:hypothetical protein